ncbi:MAG TPA: SAM-dependent methyltransferase [Cytophagales bacterium]|nr:SAM-dependent methyltransferase [Cytophagales bacterium]HCR53038.1 SAM-dependent methyltransferase [Cytophagales bacterium]
MKRKGKLYLIPTTIADNSADKVISSYVRETIKPIRFFLVEDIRTARRYLSSLSIYESIEELYFNILDKNTTEAELPKIMSPLFEGKPVGVISESGCPGVADPGALAVQYAHQNGIKVEPMVGPSSILLALMASGLNGQRFAFNGYLPVETNEAAQAIKKFENDSRSKNQTQIFIETPYRNNALIGHLLKSLHDETLLCIASNVTGETEMIKTLPVKTWRKEGITLPKEPALFLFLAL